MLIVMLTCILYAIQCSLQSLFIMDQDAVLHAIYMFHNFHLISFGF